MFGILENLNKCGGWWTPLPSRHSPSVESREPPSRMDARARDRNEEESAGMCNKAVRDLRGGVRAYIQQPVKLKAFSIKYADTCQTSKISRCGNIARTPGSRVYPPPPVPQSPFKFPFAVVLWTSAPFPTFRSFENTHWQGIVGRSSLRRIPRKFA